MKQTNPGFHSHAPRWVFDVMTVIYIATTALFLVNPNWVILVANKMFSHYGWPMVFFPTEKFWLSVAVSVPGTRAFLAFSASRRPAYAPLCVTVLQVSATIAGIMFALHFVFYKHAPLYAIGFFVELLQVFLYVYLKRKLPRS